MYDIREWDVGYMFRSTADYINAQSSSSDGFNSDWFNNFVIEYNDCYWYDEGCTEEEQRFYDCYWYDIGCPVWEEGEDDSELLIDCIYGQYNDRGSIEHYCEDLNPSGAYYDCLIDPENC